MVAPGDGEDRRRSERAIALLLVAATILLFISDAMFDVVRYHHGSLMSDSTQYVTVGAHKAGPFRLAGIADMLGSYLFMIPAALYVWREKRGSHGLVADVATAGGVAFGLVGAAAAAMLAIAGATLIQNYAAAAAADQHAIAVAYATLDTVATHALWQVLDPLLLATWLFGLAMMLGRDHTWFGRYTVVLGVVLLFSPIGLIAGAHFKGGEPEALVFLPLNIWIGWFALVFWRGVSTTAEDRAHARRRS